MRIRSQTFDRLLDYLVFLILLAMAASMILNVFCRFVLQFSLSWADELAQILLVWLTFLGAAIGIREKAHKVQMLFLRERDSDRIVVE